MNASAVLARLAQHTCSAETAKHFSGEAEQDLRRKMPLMSMRRIAQGDYLYRAGEPFQALYLLQEGFMKIAHPGMAGVARICSFFVRGELIGSKSIGHTMYQCDAIALDDCCVWEMPYSSVLQTCSRDAGLHAGLTRARVECIHRERKATAPHDGAPEQYVAELLTDLLVRYAAHGHCAGDFRIKLSANDIADYLGIDCAHARLGIARLCTSGHVIRREGELHVVDADGLQAIAQTVSACRDGATETVGESQLADA
jgi:CRP/FNR family transcriptional regulator